MRQQWFFRGIIIKLCRIQWRDGLELYNVAINMAKKKNTEAENVEWSNEIFPDNEERIMA